MVRVHIDHVIYGTSDLDAAARRVEAQVGVAAVTGGRHEGLGTHNRIVPLGDGSYIELLAVADPVEAAGSAVGAAFQAAVSVGDGLVGWAVAVRDVGPVAARLGTQISTIRREGLTARLTGVVESLSARYLPFFIERPDGPGARPDRGATSGITWIEVAGDAQRLANWLGESGLPIRLVSGDPAVHAVGVGERELRTQ